MRSIFTIFSIFVFSQVALAAPTLLLKSGKVDQEKQTITLPLYRGLYIPFKGAPAGQRRRVWYIVTDTTDPGQAATLGINYAPKLLNADTKNTKSVRQAELVNTNIAEVGVVPIFYGGRVDFSPKHSVTAGDSPNFFPPKDFNAGSVADKHYSPLAEINGEIYNMPIVAFDKDPDEIDFCGKPVDYSIMHDAVVSVCPYKKEITLKMIRGYSDGKNILYLSTEASDQMVSALEKATYAPALKSIHLNTQNELFSAVENIFVVSNGQINMYKENPDRQGLNSALAGNGDPLNILGGVPTLADDYSPLWDLYVTKWTESAFKKKKRNLIRSEKRVLSLEKQGLMTNINDGPIESSDLLVNCPVAYIF